MGSEEPRTRRRRAKSLAPEEAANAGGDSMTASLLLALTVGLAFTAGLLIGLGRAR